MPRRWVVLPALAAVVALALYAHDRLTERSPPERHPPERRGTAPAVLPDPVPSSPEKPPALPATERGEPGATLRLRLVDAATGAPLASNMRLWRLDPREDQRVATIDVPAEGRAFEGLPPGHYRCVVAQQRAGAEDPPPFLVAAPATDVAVRVATRRSFRTFLRVVDEHGRPVTRGVLYTRFLETQSVDRAPDWVRAPTTRETSSSAADIEGEAVEVEAADGRYRLGAIREDPRDLKRFVELRFEAAGRTFVRIRVSGAADAPREFVAVVVPPADLLAVVDAEEPALDEAYCFAVPEDETPVVTAQVQVAGFRPLRFEYDPRAPQRVAPSKTPTQPPK